jgi:Fe2+ or Zn2+ uptake regulation protein
MRTNIYKEHIIKLFSKKHLLTIPEIHRAISNADYSTIFRNIEKLLDDKKIKRVIVNNKIIAYESIKESHDHFICNDCGKIEEISMPHNSINGRSVEDITVRGRCNKCIN